MVWLQVDLGTRPEVQRREPVMLEDWARHLDSEGRVSNVPHLKHLIFKGVNSEMFYVDLICEQKCF